MKLTHNEFLEETLYNCVQYKLLGELSFDSYQSDITPTFHRDQMNLHIF